MGQLWCNTSHPYFVIGWIIPNSIAECPCRNATTGANILNVRNSGSSIVTVLDRLCQAAWHWYLWHLVVKLLGGRAHLTKWVILWSWSAFGPQLLVWRIGVRRLNFAGWLSGAVMPIGTLSFFRCSIEGYRFTLQSEHCSVVNAAPHIMQRGVLNTQFYIKCGCGFVSFAEGGIRFPGVASTDAKESSPSNKSHVLRRR